jgi:GAF domain-containing protein
LFEQTLRRADRERKVLEITSKIRSTNDPQIMLQVAVEELQQALNASRTQIVLQQATSQQNVPQVNLDSNGSNGGHKTDSDASEQSAS